MTSMIYLICFFMLLLFLNLVDIGEEDFDEKDYY